MLSSLREKVTYANVMATIAVFLSLGGGAYALQGRNSVNSRDVKPETLRSSDIGRNAIGRSEIAPNAAKGGDVDEATLRQVPRAGTATNISPPEELHVIGEDGEPAFGDGWENFNPGTRAVAAFYRDRQGVVHLQGQVERSSGTNATIFDLPDSYAPALQETFSAVGNGGTHATITVNPEGEVTFGTGDPLIAHLNGITWRAGQ